MTKHIESEMREAKPEWPKSPDELSTYIASLVEGEHDYGTCVYAMSLSAVAAFHYVAHVLGVTGFQASCADLDILRRTRMMAGPFAIINGEDALYPQYDLRAKVDEYLANWQPWLKEQAEKRLSEACEFVHPDVVAHWRKLAGATTEGGTHGE